MTEALLISLGQYDDPSIPALSTTTQDVEALQELLRRPDIGASRTDDVMVLVHPTLKQLKETIETFCTLRDLDETALIYLSGHAILNDRGQLFFPCRDTGRSHLELTAYSLADLKTELEACRSQQQVVILDCCFSGTFAKGMIAAQDLDKIAQDFSSTRRALLTSPTSIDYSPQHKSKQRSTYTQVLLDALETGMADGSANQPLDGTVDVTELHAYVSSHLQHALPAFSPTLYSQKDGYRMIIVYAPYLEFRKQVISLASQGEISIVGHNILQEQQLKEGIPQEIANAIREDAMLPHRQQVEKQRQYDRICEEISRRESPLSDNTQAELLQLRQVLGLPPNPFASEPMPTFVNEELRDTTSPPIEVAAIPVETPVESETPVEASGNRLTQFLRERRLLRSPDEEAEPANDRASQFLQERNISPDLVRLGLASLAILALFGAVLWALFQPFPGSKPQIASAEGWFNEGTRKAQSGNRNAAIEAYTQALNLNPTPANRAANLYYNRGLEYANNGNIDQAFSDYNEAIRLDPALADAYFNRANLAAKRGDRSAAIKDYRAAERLYQQQNNKEAQQAAQTAIRSLPQ
ncbi:MAG: tetratricopeptide repeat protein [Plectolyngbya sp. WJT66-NPBG17]|jgi:tetratricopeptide (TPR) repeat protein|nr:tetratricopeptide repeat protein [Plectolyngbya sp. WJT66-NPBG17]